LLKSGESIADVHPIHVETRQGDIRDSLADISKIQNLLNYKVQYSFDEGMAEYVESITE